uniref:Putative Metal dependent phosphohydrolase n=1 Tax=Magnetococcus massalia (strain MO-1) TaxID=451514 RepID=A0A1S7LG64_MAGMO|nr:putative Metal dependent phosphohydrolase [Candidatus Magnetococcus massalia]
MATQKKDKLQNSAQESPEDAMEAGEQLAAQMDALEDKPPLYRDPRELPEEAWVEETVLALELMGVAEQQIAKLYSDAQEGKNLDPDPLTLSVSRISESLARDQDALFSLSLLRTFDAEGFDHSINVSVYMLGLASSLELDTQKCNELGLAGMLHDVGKARLPQQLIHKTGVLSASEVKSIRQHQRYSLELLEHLTGPKQEVLSVAAQHHERMDGTGYPNGLSGSQISTAGRMAAICDSFDALTSNRSYRAARTPRESLQEILNEGRRGSLDGDLVQTFIRSIGIYPVGSLVKLADGHLGVVMRNHRSDLLHPTIRLIAKKQGDVYAPITPVRVDLADHSESEGMRIVGNETPAASRIDPCRFLPKSELYSRCREA